MMTTTRAGTRGAGRAYQRTNGTWAIAYYVRGIEHREPAAKLLGKPPRAVTEQDALRALRMRLQEILGGRFVGPKNERITVNQLLDAYLTDCELRGVKSLATIRFEMKPIRAAFGEERAVHLAAPRIAQWISEMLAGGSARGTVKLHADYLRAAMRVAQRQGQLASVPPFPTITVNNARKGFFEPEEFELVVGKLGAPLDDIARFAYACGWRESEILSLEWSRVDRAERVVRLGDSKNGRGRSLPLVGDLWDLIERRWAARVVNGYLCPFVFHRRGRRVTKDTLWPAWRKATDAAGLRGKLFHDFRRTAARDLIAAGNDYKTAMDITGHRSMTVFHRYQIVDTRLMQQGLARLQAHRQGAPAKVVRLAQADKTRTNKPDR